MESLEQAVECLATALYYEARGESQQGQLLVIDTIINRVFAKNFPDTVCGVIYEPGQFHVLTKPDELPVELIDLADLSLTGAIELPNSGALYFHALGAGPFNRNRLFVVGNHVFYE
jgi:N-acetylmuramoyl-L-alanine amidase